MGNKKKTTSAREWKGKKVGVDLTLPSGNVCLAMRPGMDTFLKSNRIPNSLMPIIQESINAAKGGKPGKELDIDLAALFDDPEKMAAVIEFQDAVIMAAVIQPPLAAIPADDEVRDDDILYVDDVDALDKAFLFQWALGGAADVEGFRKGLAETVAGLPASETVELSSVGTSGD